MTRAITVAEAITIGALLLVACSKNDNKGAAPTATAPASPASEEVATDAETRGEEAPDRAAIEALITSFFDNVDRRQFAAAEAQLTEQVAVDYTAPPRAV